MGPRPTVAALLAAALFLAGCASGGTSQDPAPSATTGPTQAGKAAAPNRTASPAPVAAPHAATLYLTADGHLSLARPAAGSVTATMLPTAFATGFPAVEFVGDPVPAPTRIAAKTVVATLWLQADAPMPSNGFFDIGVWIGSTRGDTLSTVTTLPAPAIAPGTVQRLDLRLEFGTQLPIPVPRGESLKAQVVVGGDYGAGTSRILVGGDHASSLNLTLEGLAGDPFAATPVAEERLTGQLTGASPGSCGSTPMVSKAEHPVKVKANASFLEIRLAGSGANPIDLDMRLSGPGGVLASSNGPKAEESILLGGPDFKAYGGKDLTLEVGLCVGQATYEAVVRQA